MSKSKVLAIFLGGLGSLGWTLFFLELWRPFFQRDIPWISKKENKPLKALPHKRKSLPVTSSRKLSTMQLLKDTDTLVYGCQNGDIKQLEISNIFDHSRF